MKWLGLFFTLLLPACVTRQQVQADMYMHDQIPAGLCASFQAIRNYGIFRVVTCASKPKSPQCQHGEKSFEELRPYCSPSIKNYESMSDADIEKWLGELTAPKP